ncbi:MAG: rRNA maturation RNase YbeY [Pseudomonadota bacterium]
MPKAKKCHADSPIQVAELVIEHDGWEKEISSLELLCGAICNKVLNHHESANSKIIILLSDNAAVQKLNFEWRGQNKPTNVLSFPNIDPDYALKRFPKSVKRFSDKKRGKQRNLEPHSDSIRMGYALGDIAMAFEYCEAEAIGQGKTFKNHFAHLLIHGVLHLLGYDHINETEAEEMESLEAEILRDFGIADPYLIVDNRDKEAEGVN